MRGPGVACDRASSYVQPCCALALTHLPSPGGLASIGSLPVRAVCSQGVEFLKYADENGDKKLSLDEWMEFFMGFWRFHPQVARNNVAYLMNRAEELRMMPAMPPGM